MKLIIDIPEYLYEAILEYPNVSGLNVSTLESAILHGTPIPDNATNGEWVVDKKVIDKSRKPTTYHFDTHCSECGFKYAYTTDKEDSIPTNYCPNCGVHMKGADR